MWVAQTRPEASDAHQNESARRPDDGWGRVKCVRATSTKTMGGEKGKREGKVGSDTMITGGAQTKLESNTTHKSANEQG